MKTKYCGLQLRNPLVIGASNIVADIQNLKKLQEAGAAAVVFKSLFEEQIQLESAAWEQRFEDFSNWDAEHETFFPAVKHAGPAEHLVQLKKARQAIDIPLIGSLNCVTPELWVEYAQKIADTGVDALELNFYYHNIDFKKPAFEIEEEQLAVLRKVKQAVTIPVSVKLSPFYSNILSVVSRFDQNQADGFVLFNRLFQPDIDIEHEAHHYPYNFSAENDNRLALRYAGLLYNRVSGSIVANTGVLQGRDVIKMLLAGADAVQVVSAVYRRGMGAIETMLREIEAWMSKKGYSSISEFRGKLAKDNLADPFAYKRAQYVDILMKSEIFMPYHPKQSETEADGEGDKQIF
jgi:dihydroorotate dehydrogenase (fumarate)